MLLFYTPDIHPSHPTFVLTEEESKHAVRVLRLQMGDKIHLVNGKGDLFDAEIIDPHPKRTTLKVLQVTSAYQGLDYALHIAIAPTKNMDRLEWFIEKATEIGIDEITPIICERSERKEVKVERLEKVAIAAMKQSLKAYLPKINPAVSFKQFISSMEASDLDVQKGIAHCIEDDAKSFIGKSFSPKGKYSFLIGPEGDFSPNEIEQALASGFQPISLGDARLRTETAAVAATLEFSLLNR